MSTRQPVTVEADEPFASSPGKPTIRFHVPTTPGFSTGATISRETAQELLSGLQKVLGEEPGMPALTISTETHGVLWRRFLDSESQVTMAAEDHTLATFLNTVGPIDVQFTVRP